jgi:hypothetical protein
MDSYPTNPELHLGTAIGADHPHSWLAILIADKSDTLAIRGPCWAGSHGMLKKDELDRFATGQPTV